MSAYNGVLEGVRAVGRYIQRHLYVFASALLAGDVPRQGCGLVVVEFCGLPAHIGPASTGKVGA